MGEPYALSSLRRAVADGGDRVALICGDERVTWTELGRGVNRAANAMIARGIGRGDRVAMLSKSSIGYVEVFFGALAAGACAVPLPTMANADALALMLEDSAAKLLFLSRELADAVPGGAAERIDLDDRGWAGDASDAEPDVEVAPTDDFNIIYSSGTTGVPKGIVHDHATRAVFIDNLRAFAFGPNAVTLVSTPLYSNTTMVAWLPSMCAGATQVLMPKFDAREWLALCEREKVTHAMLVPVQYDRILRVDDFDRFDLSSLMVKLSTSAPLRAGTKREILDRMPGMLVEIYGLTEGGVTTVLLASAFPNKLDSVGQPVPGCEIKIVGDDGEELPVGRTGEVVGRSGFMMKRYQNRPDATDAMLWRDAAGNVFYRSGDIGRLDDDGFLYLLDRKKDMIISGGLNVFATDIEVVLAAHDAVRDVAVIGVPSERWGESPLALVVLEPGADVAAEALRDWVNERVSKHQRVAAVELRDELPKSQIGKVLKRELRAPYWEGQA